MNIIIYEINNNTIIEEKIKKSKEIICLKEKDINKDIRIINSFEEVKRYRQWWIESQYDNKYENETEIKENCKIEINNKIIPFSYFYRFKEKGKYIIKYSFKNNIIKTSFMFFECILKMLEI